MSRYILLGMTIILTLLLQACGKDDPVIGDIKQNSLEVKINGDKKMFNDAKGRWVEGGNYLEITATNDGSEWLTITILSEATRVPAGAYTLDDNTPFSMLSSYTLIDNNAQLNFAATKGTLATEDTFLLEINKINNTAVEGTFSGALVRVEGTTTLGIVTLTEGKFNVSIKPN